MKTAFQKFSYMLGTLLLLFLYSCTDEIQNDILTENTPEVQVIEVPSWTKGNRSECPSMKIMKFRDMESYNKIIAKMNQMDKKQRLDYFKAIGFEGAYTMLQQADMKMDQILELDDSLEIARKIEECKNEFKDVIVFNDTDEYDITPNLKFSDENSSLVGNTEGFFMIGDNMYSPQTPLMNFVNRAPSFEIEAPGPIEPGFKPFANASLSIEKGKYTSKVTLGRLVNGNSLEVETITRKKVFLWHKIVDAFHSLTLDMQNNKWHFHDYLTNPYGKRWLILWIPCEEAQPSFNAYITDFQSTACEGESGNAQFTNVSAY